jgi:hypothetical protein
MPLSAGQRVLGDALAELKAFGLKQSDIPFIVKLVENPAYDFPGIELFHDGTDLAAHDRLHVILGRGLLPKDEAFVIGFTMGSSNRVTTAEQHLYALFAKYLYPQAYRFTDEDIQVYRDAVHLGFVSDCVPLASADLAALDGRPIAQARLALGIEEELLRAYYAIEHRRYPDSPESRRLLD